MLQTSLRQTAGIVLAFLGGIALSGCKKKAEPVASPPTNLIAWVNQSPLTESDLRQGSRGHGADLMGPPRAALLDQLIHDELLAQKAQSLGLEQDPQFKERMARSEAQYRAARRKELADIFFRRQIVDKTEVSAEEVRQFYAANETSLKASIHVLQILFREENLAKQALAEIRSGSTFESVAAKQFTVLPQGAPKPWDLGFLNWRQIPAVWRRTVFAMKPGDVSDVIAGENQRYWILKIVDRKELPHMTFESLQTSLQDEMKSAKILSERIRIAGELRKMGDIKLIPAGSPPP